MKILGVDLSTVNIGFCELSLFDILAFSVRLNYKSHKMRRRITRNYLYFFKPDYVVLESVRLFHKGFINIDAIKRLGGLTYLIVDFFDCPVYSIDVRSWKKYILGSAKVDKRESITYVKEKYAMVVDNDLSDAVCIAEMGLRFKDRLKEVE